ncbi:MAG: terminase TerL endonuclease subunit, partial [Cycloclasticus sp.]
LPRLARKAMSQISAVNGFLTKRLNVWVNSGTAWMDMKAWDAQADHKMKITDFYGENCHLGVDLASKIDFSCVNVTFKREIDGEDHYYGFTFSYLNEEAVEDSKNSQYSGWERSGHLITTDGNVTDHRRIEQDIRDIASNYNIISAAFDDHQGVYMMSNLSDEGLRVVNFPPKTGNMSAPMKEWQALVLSGRYHHNGCPVMTWMVSNVVAKANEADHIYPRKEFPENKIDGAVAQIMALGRWLAERPEVNPYADRGFAQL